MIFDLLPKSSKDGFVTDISKEISIKFFCVCGGGGDDVEHQNTLI